MIFIRIQVLIYSYTLIFNSLESKIAFVSSLLAFDPETSPILQEWTLTALYHLPFFKSNFESSILIIIQLICKAFLSLIPPPLSRKSSLKSESNLIILVNALRKTLSFSLKNEWCFAEIVKQLPLIFSTLVYVLDSLDPQFVHAEEIKNAVSSILKEVGKQHSVRF